MAQQKRSPRGEPQRRPSQHQSQQQGRASGGGSRGPAPPPAKRAAPASAFDEAEATKAAKRLTVPKLRAALEAAGADTKGLKAALVERLVGVQRTAASTGKRPRRDPRGS